MSTAWRSVQRNFVRYAIGHGEGEQGLALARSLAMTTYRSVREFEDRFPGEAVRETGRFVFPVEAYIVARGEAYAKTYRPEAFVCLSESIDLHRHRARVDRGAADAGRRARGPAGAGRRHARAARPLRQHLPAARDQLDVRPRRLLQGSRPCCATSSIAHSTRARTIPMSKQDSIQTRTVRAALETDTQHGAVVPPIHLTSTFAFGGYGEKREYDYSRSGNPTRDALGRALAELEGGAGAVVTASGMGAVSLVTQLFQPDAAWPSCRTTATAAPIACSMRCTCAARCRCSSSTSRTRRRCERGAGGAAGAGLDRDAEQSAAAHRRHRGRRRRARTRPGRWSWPTTRSCRRSGSGRWSSAPTSSIHSTTKYLNGHSDVVGGAVIAATPELHEQVQVVGQLHRRDRRAVRQLPDPARPAHAARAHARARRKRRARRRAAGAGIRPSRASTTRAWRTHPGHAIARRQQHGFGAMVSFELAGGLDRVKALLGNLELFSLAESLGGVESLVAHPASMTHAAMDEAARERGGHLGNAAAAVDRHRGWRRPGCVTCVSGTLRCRR